MRDEVSQYLSLMSSRPLLFLISLLRLDKVQSMCFSLHGHGMAMGPARNKEAAAVLVMKMCPVAVSCKAVNFIRQDCRQLQDQLRGDIIVRE